jgi:hypothetical protein
MKKLLTGGLNAEDAEHLIGETEAINMQNIRIGTTDNGASGYLENIQSPLLKTQTLPAGTNITIGTASDDANDILVKFNWNSNGSHGIYLLSAGVWYTVVLDADITGGLGFSKYSLIHSAYIVDGQLVWTDNDNEPRMVNLAAFNKAYGTSPYTSLNTVSLPVDEAEITIIKKPPVYPPLIDKQYDSGFNNNFTGNESFQFAFQYLFYDGTYSVLSAWSKNSLLNKSDENFNFIKVFSDNQQVVPNTARIIRLWVRDSATSKVFKIKDWDKEVATELAEINAGILTFSFYNNARGEFLDDPTSVKPFDSVPLKSNALAVAKNRTILADNTEGYDTPKTTSLSLALSTSIGLGFTSLNKTLISVFHRNGRGQPETYAFSGWFVYLTEVVPVGYYLINGTSTLREDTAFIGGHVYGNGGDVPLPNPALYTSVALSGLTFKGADLQTVAANTKPSDTNRWDGPYATVTSFPCSITGISTSTYRVYLPKSQYRAGVVFYDRYLRKCGVVTNDSAKISIPSRNYAFTVGYASINWTLSNASALTEIPDWAYYYIPVRTLNTRTRYFVAGYDNTAKYATKDNNGLFVYTTTAAMPTNCVALAINAGALLQANLGYAFSEGDQCILIRDDDTTYELPVIGQDGKYILLQPKEVGNLAAKTFVYEIYTPHKASTEEPYYEMGEMFPVTLPGTSSRAYSTLSSLFRTDTVALTRNYNSSTYYAEAMNPNDVYYQRWDTDAGRINIVTKQGQVRKKTGICFSSVFIPGTSVNGLSSFEVLNKDFLSEEIGAIRKIILASKVQAEGSVLLTIGENETVSIYLGEKQLFDTEGNSFLIKSDSFIGQKNSLQGSFGTQNPESVVENKGRVFWFDAKSNSFIRYAGNGLFQISNNKLKRVAKLFAQKYLSLSVGDIETLGSRPFVFGGYDSYHDEYLACIPATEIPPPKGYVDTSIGTVTVDTLYSIKHIAVSTGVYKAYGAYAVILLNVVVPGWYILTGTAISGSNVGSVPSYPTLAAAPSSVNFADLEFAGSIIPEMLEYINQKMIVTVSARPTTYSYVLTPAGSINVDTNGSGLPYPYDIYDGLAKTLVYKNEADRWMGSFDMEPEWLTSVADKTYAFKEGQTYQLNAGTDYNNFFGTQTYSQIMFLLNADPSKIKEYSTMAIEGNIKPDFVHLQTETPNLQRTDLRADDFIGKEGVFYTYIKRDRLSPNVTGSYLLKQNIGDKMRGPWIKVMLQFEGSELLQFRFVNIDFKMSAGHTKI